MKDYIIHFAQTFPEFRIAELQELASFYGFSVDLSGHREECPFLLVSLENDEQASQLVSRSVMSYGIYELWGYGKTYEELHVDVKEKSSDKFDKYKECSFKFDFKSFQGKQSNREKVKTIESFSYLAFDGKIDLKTPDETFVVMEEYIKGGPKVPVNIWFARELQLSQRAEGLIERYDLKREIILEPHRLKQNYLWLHVIWHKWHLVKLCMIHSPELVPFGCSCEFWRVNYWIRYRC